MDSAGINFYQKCIKTLLSAYEDLQTEWSSVETLFDDERMRYMALRLGWNDQRRIHLCLIHIDIQDGMVIIQANNTEDALDDDLVALGVPRDKISLGILPPDVREQLSKHQQQQETPEPQSYVHSQQMIQTA
ncbi:MAG: XisI protein [bacterium]|nr:XisI protein [bacterium]